MEKEHGQNKTENWDNAGLDQVDGIIKNFETH